MEKFIGELKKVFAFKDSIDVGDIVLIAAKDPPMLIYAYILSIERDTGRKDEWWHVTMSMLSVPPQKTTWTLRPPQMTGMESFTMGGEVRFMKAVDFSTPESTGKMNKVKAPQGTGLKRVK